MDTVRGFLDISPDVEQVLVENDIDLAAILRDRGLDASIAREADPVATGESQTKDVSLVLIASAAVIVAATPILREVIQMVSRRPVIISHKKLQPVEDSQGNQVKDSKGDPIMQWVEVPTALPAAERGELAQNLEIKGPWGIVIKYGSTEKP